MATKPDKPAKPGWKPHIATVDFNTAILAYRNGGALTVCAKVSLRLPSYPECMAKGSDRTNLVILIILLGGLSCDGLSFVTKP